LPFIGGALWLRHAVDDMYTAWSMAGYEAEYAFTDAGKTDVPRQVSANPARDLDRVLWPGIPVAILLVGFVAWAATNRALVPVEKIRKQTAEISTRSLD
jgi:hypothetical protein